MAYRKTSGQVAAQFRDRVETGDRVILEVVFIMCHKNDMVLVFFFLKFQTGLVLAILTRSLKPSQVWTGPSELNV